MIYYPRSNTRRFRHKPRAGRPRGAAAMVAAGLVAGCAREAPKAAASDDSLPPQEPTTLWNSPHFGLVDHPTTVVAAQGMPPLLYNLKRGERVRVVDATTGKQLADAIAAGPAIVSIETNGIMIGGQTLASGPLPAEHSYQIVLDLTAPQQSWHTGVEVAPIRQPQTTRPASQ